MPEAAGPEEPTGSHKAPREGGATDFPKPYISLCFFMFLGNVSAILPVWDILLSFCFHSAFILLSFRFCISRARTPDRYDGSIGLAFSVCLLSFGVSAFAGGEVREGEAW